MKKKTLSFEKCLTDLVGFRGCVDNKILHYVDSIAGISEVYMANIYNQDTFSDFVDFENAVKEEAYHFFKLSLINSINKYKIVQSIIIDTDNPQPRQKNNVPEIIPMQERWTGQVVDVMYNKDLSINIESFFVNSLTEAETTFSIFDLNSSEQVYSENVKIKKGINEIPVNQKYLVEYQGENLFIGIRTDKITTSELRCGGLMSMCSCDVSSYASEFKPAYFDVCDEINISMFKLQQQNGTCIKAQIMCDIDNLICRNKEQFANIYKYAFALELLKHGLVTSRRNWQVDNLDVYKLREITIPMIEQKFYQTLSNTVKSMQNLLNNSVCFLCDPNLTSSIIYDSLV